MKIISYNVNGIRAAIKKDLLGWTKSENPDVLCLQETKAHPEQVDLSGFEKLGYQSYWANAEKTLTAIPPTHETFKRYRLEAIVADSKTPGWPAGGC